MPYGLETIYASQELRSGGHNWCGAATGHVNVYVVNGRYMHRSSTDLLLSGWEFSLNLLMQFTVARLLLCFYRSLYGVDV